ncbi:MAG: DUF885 family protein [Pseudomonadota bacterium]
MQVFRDFHKRTAIVCSIIALVMACTDTQGPVRIDAKALAEVEALLNDAVLTEAALTPEVTSRLGLDSSLAPAAKSQLSDVSQASFERQRLLRLDLATRLSQAADLPMDQPLTRDLVLARLALRDLIVLQASGKGHISLSQTRIYTIDPFAGLWIEGPQALIRDHVIETADDAEAYVARMADLADGLQDTRRRLIADAATGHLPPAEILRETRLRIERLIAEDAFLIIQSTLETFSLGLPDDGSSTHASRIQAALQIYQEDLLPAYVELAQSLSDLEDQAPIPLGVWTQPGGVTLYNDLLQVWAGSTSSVGTLWPSLESEAAIERQITQTNSQTAQDNDPDRLLQNPDDLSNQADPVSYLEARLAGAAGSLQIRENKDLIVMPMTGLNFLTARHDDKRPATIEYDSEILEQLPTDVSKALTSSQYMAATRLYNDAVQTASRRSLIRAYLHDSPFENAWSTYFYSVSSPDAQSIEAITRFQAAIAATDLGLHAKRWTLENAKAFLVEQTGVSKDTAEQITLRLSANPGQAVGVYVHLKRFQSLETRTRQVLGYRFDLSSFLDVLLSDGPRPLDIVESDIENWYETLMNNR